MGLAYRAGLAHFGKHFESCNLQLAASGKIHNLVLFLLFIKRKKKK